MLATVGAVTSRTTVLAVAGMALALVLTGCRPEPAVEPTPTFSSEAEAFAAAEATYREYVKALNEVDLSDPETFEDVYAWTTGELNASDRESFSGWHAEGLQKVGLAHLISVTGRSLVPEEGMITVAACYDVSDVDVRDAAGNSVVDPNRPDIQALEVTLVSTGDTDTGLALTSINPATEAERC